jgi:hypothetical protein
MWHKGRPIMRFHQPVTRNIHITPIWKCQNATRYMIWLGNSCPRNIGIRSIWKCQNTTRYMIWLRSSCLRNIGIRPIWKCQNATRYMIWLRSFCPMVCCHINETLLTISCHLGGSSERLSGWLFLNTGNVPFF